MSEQNVQPFAATDPREWKRVMLAAAAKGPMAIDEATGVTHLLRHRGPHYCLGAALARLTLEESVRGVADLAPALTAVADDIEWAQVLGRSPAHLPVAV